MAVFRLVASCVLLGLGVRAQEPPRLGVEVGTADEATKAAHGLAPEQPALTIVRVLPGTVAAERSLRSGDLVLAVEGAPCASPAQLCERIAAFAPGRLVRLSLSRSAVLCRPDQDGNKRFGVWYGDPGPFGRFEHEAAGADARDGALVTAVIDGTAAHDAGILAGDRIVRLGGTAIGSHEELAAAIGTMPVDAPRAVQLERAVRLPFAASPATTALPRHATHALLGLCVSSFDLQKDGTGEWLSLARALQLGGVFADSPAAAAGLRKSDVLVAIDGDDAPLASPDALLQHVRQRPPRSTLRVDVYRTLQAPAGQTGAERAAALGLRADWNAAEGRLEIAAVERGSAAETVGLRPGTPVVRLQGRPVKSEEDWPDYLDHVPAGEWLFLGLRFELAVLPVHLDPRPAVELTVDRRAVLAGETLAASWVPANLPAGETTLSLVVERDGAPVSAPVQSRIVLAAGDAPRAFSLPVPAGALPGEYVLCVTLGEGSRAVCGRSAFAITAAASPAR